MPRYCREIPQNRFWATARQVMGSIFLADCPLPKKGEDSSSL
jgi:hypothetical protein